MPWRASVDRLAAAVAASGAAAGPAPHVTEATDAGEAIAETGRLFLRNLAYSATEDDLTALLAPYGELREVHLVLDRFLVPLSALISMCMPSLCIFSGLLSLFHTCGALCSPNMHVLPGFAPVVAYRPFGLHGVHQPAYVKTA